MFIRTGGFDSYVAVHGPLDGKTVVMLHSIGTSHTVWETQAQILSRSCLVVRPDFRGHGLTEVVDGPYTIEMLAEDITAILDVLQVQRVCLAGLSIGGMVAQIVAAKRPDLVAGLVLCSTALSIPSAQFWRDRAAEVRKLGIGPAVKNIMPRWVPNDSLSDPPAVGLSRILLGTSDEGYASSAEAVAEANLSSISSILTLPTLVLVGSQDQVTTPEMAQQLSQTIRGSGLYQIDGAAHIPTVTHDDMVTRHLQSMLANLN